MKTTNVYEFEKGELKLLLFSVYFKETHSWSSNEILLIIVIFWRGPGATAITSQENG